jgi:drug/metabolite transporter (DMT)-like permease
VNIYITILLTLCAALVASSSQLLFKKSVKKIVSFTDIIMLLKNKGVVLGGLGYVAGLVLYLVALSGHDLSLVFPIFASSFIFVTLFSRIFLKERITILRAMGVFLIFVGITIVALS